MSSQQEQEPNVPLQWDSVKWRLQKKLTRQRLSRRVAFLLSSVSFVCWPAWYAALKLITQYDETRATWTAAGICNFIILIIDMVLFYFDKKFFRMYLAPSSGSKNVSKAKKRFARTFSGTVQIVADVLAYFGAVSFSHAAEESMRLSTSPVLSTWCYFVAVAIIAVVAMVLAVRLFKRSAEAAAEAAIHNEEHPDEVCPEDWQRMKSMEAMWHLIVCKLQWLTALALNAAVLISVVGKSSAGLAAGPAREAATALWLYAAGMIVIASVAIVRLGAAEKAAAVAIATHPAPVQTAPASGAGSAQAGTPPLSAPLLTGEGASAALQLELQDGAGGVSSMADDVENGGGDSRVRRDFDDDTGAEATMKTPLTPIPDSSPRRAGNAPPTPPAQTAQGVRSIYSRVLVPWRKLPPVSPTLAWASVPAASRRLFSTALALSAAASINRAGDATYRALGRPGDPTSMFLFFLAAFAVVCAAMCALESFANRSDRAVVAAQQAAEDEGHEVPSPHPQQPASGGARTTPATGDGAGSSGQTFAENDDATAEGKADGNVIMVGSGTGGGERAGWGAPSLALSGMAAALRRIPTAVSASRSVSRATALTEKGLSLIVGNAFGNAVGAAIGTVGLAAALVWALFVTLVMVLLIPWTQRWVDRKLQLLDEEATKAQSPAPATHPDDAVVV